MHTLHDSIYICNNGLNFPGAATNGNSGFYISTDTTESGLDKLLFNAINLAFGYQFNHSDFLFLSEEAAQHTDAYGLYFQTKGIHEYVKAKVQASPISTFHFTCTPVYMPFVIGEDKNVASPKQTNGSLIPANMTLAEFIMAYIHCKSVLY